MKRSNILLLLCFGFLFSSSLRQLTFTNPIVSKAGEYTLDTSKSNGQLLTLSTSNDFSRIIPDAISDGDEFYITLKCLTSGGRYEKVWLILGLLDMIRLAIWRAIHENQ